MRNKILNGTIIVGLICIAVAIALLINEIFDASSLGFQYLILAGLLITFIGLNFRFRRPTDVEETTASLRRSRRMVARIQPNAEIRFVQLRTIRNQIAYAEVYVNDLVAKYDLYNLQTLAKKFDDVKNHYNLDDDFKSTFTSNEIKEDLRVIDQLIKEINLLKK